jgi:hypothetical protein
MNKDDLAANCIKLENLQGDLKQFKDISSPKQLFDITSSLQLPENVELRQRWRNAIRTGEKVRIDLLRCKALTILEQFDAESKAPEVSFAKTLLADHFTESTETGKQRVLKAFGVHPTGESNPEDEIDLLEKDLGG